MGFLELLLVPLLVLIVGLPLALAAIVSARGRRIDDLEQRLKRIEQLVSAIAPVKVEPGGTPTAIEAREPPHRITEADIAVSAEPVVLATEVKPTSRPAISWEALVGGRALGWAAVIVLLFATAFFLRYAFENQWIGPVGRVSLGILGGIALATAGRYYHARGWRVFSQMLTAGAVILLYLAMYGAFGFYHLIAQREAGLVLALLVAEAALVAMRYEAPSIALMAALGGLLTPLLMQTDRDQYVSLFTYLAVLDGGFLVLLSLRAWPAIGSVALVGTQFLFWNWHASNYHPENCVGRSVFKS